MKIFNSQHYFLELHVEFINTLHIYACQKEMTFIAWIYMLTSWGMPLVSPIDKSPQY